MSRHKRSGEEIITSMFVDIEDSSGISNYFEKSKYETFLSEFHKTIRNVLKKTKWHVIAQEINHKFMGDEFIAFFPHKKYGDNALEYALELASILKYEWYFSGHNQSRLWGDKEHTELNIGINTGDVSVMEYPILSRTRKKKRSSYEGFPITLAKRIQSVAEESQSSRIIVADRFYREYSNATNQGYTFHYMGKKSFKGIAQRLSCYEWLGSDFYEYLDFAETKDKKVKKTLKALYDKNPHNPWHAALLANYYFSLGEQEYYEGRYDNEFYKACAKVCIDTIYNVSNYNLRKLNEILFTCLEVGGRWEELCFRSAQAVASDPTFSSALAHHAKSLYMRDDPYTEDAKEAAQRLTILFHQSQDYESLFIGNFILARYYSKKKFNRPKIIKHIKAAVDYAQRGEIDWAYTEYEPSKPDFEDIREDREFKSAISKLKRMWERINEE